MDLVRDKRVKDALMNSTVQNMFERGELRKDHPLQRKPGRWSGSDKEGLIASVLKDEDIDSIKVCEQLTNNGVVLWVIDGLQRLTTLNSYLNGGFKLGKNVEFPTVTYQSAKRDAKGNIIKDEYGNYDYELVEYDLRGKFYCDLPIELKEKFNNYKIDMVKHLDCTDEEIGYHIRRYNKQKSMNASENAVTFMDNIAKEVKRVSLNNRFFKNDVYKEMERNNGTIERIVTESVMCMFHLDKWQKQSRNMGEFLNRNSSKQEFDRLNDNLNRLEAVYDESFGDIFTSKDSFIWFTLFDKFTSYDLPDRSFADFIRSYKADRMWERKFNGESFVDIDKNRSTKDKSVIVRKLEILECLLSGFLKVSSAPAGRDELEEFAAKMLEIDAGELHEDIDFYIESLDDLTARAVKDGSGILARENRPSLLAMMVYSYKNDVNLDDWLKEYAAKNDRYIADQKKNFIRMKTDFERYAAGKSL